MILSQPSAVAVTQCQQCSSFFHPRFPMGPWDDHSLLLAFYWHSPAVFLYAAFYQLISKLQLQHLPLHILLLWTQTHFCLTLQPFYFQMLLLRLYLLPALPPHNPFENQIIFHFALAETFSSALFCPAPFHDSEFLSLQLCYESILETKPRHTVWRSARCLGSL